MAVDGRVYDHITSAWLSGHTVTGWSEGSGLTHVDTTDINGYFTLPFVNGDGPIHVYVDGVPGMYVMCYMDQSNPTVPQYSCVRDITAPLTCNIPQQPAVTISGTVRDPGGVPVTNFYPIYIYDDAGDQAPWVGNSMQVPPGGYSIDVAVGYSSYYTLYADGTNQGSPYPEYPSEWYNNKADKTTADHIVAPAAGVDLQFEVPVNITGRMVDIVGTPLDGMALNLHVLCYAGDGSWGYNKPVAADGTFSCSRCRVGQIFHLMLSASWPSDYPNYMCWIWKYDPMPPGGGWATAGDDIVAPNNIGDWTIYKIGTVEGVVSDVGGPIDGIQVKMHQPLGGVVAAQSAGGGLYMTWSSNAEDCHEGDKVKMQFEDSTGGHATRWYHDKLTEGTADEVTLCATGIDQVLPVTPVYVCTGTVTLVGGGFPSDGFVGAYDLDDPVPFAGGMFPGPLVDPNEQASVNPVDGTYALTLKEGHRYKLCAGTGNTMPQDLVGTWYGPGNPTASKDAPEIVPMAPLVGLDVVCSISGTSITGATVNWPLGVDMAYILHCDADIPVFMGIGLGMAEGAYTPMGMFDSGTEYKTVFYALNTGTMAFLAQGWYPNYAISYYGPAVKHAGNATGIDFDFDDIIVPPTIEIISTVPDQGRVGDTVVISGSGFGVSQGSGWVKFGGVEAVIVAWADIEITVVVP